jgi:hypothetical protein
MSALTGFCTQLLNLLNNLHELYPSDSDISISITSVNLLKQTNPRKLLEMFSSYVLKYEEQLMNENENFFLETNLVDDNNLDKNNYNYADTIMINLKKYWKELDKESKINIWKYFKVLILLSKKC